MTPLFVIQQCNVTQVSVVASLSQPLWSIPLLGHSSKPDVCRTWLIACLLSLLQWIGPATCQCQCQCQPCSASCISKGLWAAQDKVQETSSLPSTPAFFSQQGMPLPGFGNLHSCGSLDVEDFRAAQRLPTPRSPAAPRTLEGAQASGRGGEWLLAALPGLAYCGGAAPALPRREPGAVRCLRHRARPPRPARPSACRRVSTAQRCGCSPRCLNSLSAAVRPCGAPHCCTAQLLNSTNPCHFCLALAALPGLALCGGATLRLLVLDFHLCRPTAVGQL